jgi:hypothetical protein
MASVLACGPGSLLSGLAGAYLYRLVRGAPPRPEVTSPTERRIEGIVTRRNRRSAPRRATTFRGIPVETVPDVLIDIASELTAADLARACHEAGVLFRITPGHVARALRSRPSAPGSATLTRILRGEVRVTLSKLERAFLALLVADGLPLPLTNRVAGGRRVDCRWPDQRLTVELNGYLYHGSRHAWEQDHVRAREAYARGDEFRSYTYADVFEDPTRMLAELRGLLLRDRPA